MKRGKLSFTIACAAFFTLYAGNVFTMTTLAESDTTAPVIEGVEDGTLG